MRNFTQLSQYYKEKHNCTLFHANIIASASILHDYRSIGQAVSTHHNDPYKDGWRSTSDGAIYTASAILDAITFIETLRQDDLAITDSTPDHLVTPLKTIYRILHA